MKASVKFRDDQKPLFRAKVPLSILGLPFQSGIVAGESKELALNLGSFFESGPAVKISYRPNDTWNPFSLVVKTGTGHFGSPAGSSMVMSAEFSLVGGRGNPNPRFMLHFKPRFGDFSVKKSQSSSVLESLASKSLNGVVSEDEDGSIEVVDSPTAAKRLTAGAIAGLISGTEVSARTSIPLRNRAAVSFRWGVRVPEEIKTNAYLNPTAGISLQKIPFLVMNKISIEHVYGPDQKKTTSSEKSASSPENLDVVEACFMVKHQLEGLQAENGMLRKAVEDLRRDIGGAPAAPASSEWNRSNNNLTGKADRRSNEKKVSSDIRSKSPESDAKGVSGV